MANLQNKSTQAEPQSDKDHILEALNSITKESNPKRLYHQLSRTEQDKIVKTYAGRLGLEDSVLMMMMRSAGLLKNETEEELLPESITLSKLPTYLGSFPYQFYPEKLREFIDLVAVELKVTDYSFLSAAILSAISTAASGRFTAYSKATAGYSLSNRKKDRDKNIIPNLFMTLVGDSSIGKSPAINIAFSPLNEINEALFYRWREEQAAWDCYVKANKEERQGMELELQHYGIQDEPDRGAVFLKDFTLSTIGLRLLGNQKFNLALCIYQHEMTQFFSQTQRSSSEKGATGVLNQLADCEDIQIDRKGGTGRKAGESLYVSNPRTTFIGLNQPEFIPQQLSAANQGVGFAGRFVYVSPQQLRYNSPETMPSEAYDLMALYEDSLQNIALGKAAIRRPEANNRLDIDLNLLKSHNILFSAEAEERHLDFNRDLDELCNRIRESVDKGKDKLIAKHKRTMPQLALLLHIAERMYRLDFETAVQEKLSLETLEKAIALTDYFRSELLLLMLEADKTAYDKLPENHRTWYDRLPSGAMKREQMYETESHSPKTFGISKNVLSKLLKNEELFTCIQHAIYQKAGASSLILASKKNKLSTL
jgi:hypothetical protein